MARSTPFREREWMIAKILRPLGRRPMTRSQAQVAAGLLGVHPLTAYPLHFRLLQNLFASWQPVPLERVDEIVDDVFSWWLLRRNLAYPLIAPDLTKADIGFAMAVAGTDTDIEMAKAHSWATTLSSWRNAFDCRAALAGSCGSTS